MQPDALGSTRLIASSLAALVLTAIVFMAVPDIDLDFARLFFRGGNTFVGQNATGIVARRLFYWAPFVVLGIGVMLYLGRHFAKWPLPAPTAAGLGMMVVSIAIGPGLLVNTVLKNHSHRPRPYQVMEFGGQDAFQPYFRFDGACRRNCSFVSGESASAFWTVAPALLAPLPWRPFAVAAAVLFGIAASLLRMAFGGHFLSDTIFAGLLTWLVILACWRLVTRLTGRSPSEDTVARITAAEPPPPDRQ